MSENTKILPIRYRTYAEKKMQQEIVFADPIAAIADARICDIS